MLKCMAAAVLEGRNIESASDFFNRIMDLATRTQTLNAEGAPDISRIGCNWYKRFLPRHPAFKPAYSRAMDNDCAMNNPETITEYFNVLKSTVDEFKIMPQNIYNMDKGYTGVDKILFIELFQVARKRLELGTYRYFVSLDALYIYFISLDNFFVLYAGKLTSRSQWSIG